jgi:hypothetical protein
MNRVQKLNPQETRLSLSPTYTISHLAFYVQKRSTESGTESVQNQHFCVCTAD